MMELQVGNSEVPCKPIQNCPSVLQAEVPFSPNESPTHHQENASHNTLDERKCRKIQHLSHTLTRQDHQLRSRAKCKFVVIVTAIRTLTKTPPYARHFQQHRSRIHVFSPTWTGGKLASQAIILRVFSTDKTIVTCPNLYPLPRMS